MTNKILPGYCPSTYNHQHFIGYPIAAVCPFCGQTQQFILDEVERLRIAASTTSLGSTYPNSAN